MKDVELKALATKWKVLSDSYRRADRYSVPGMVLAECALDLNAIFPKVPMKTVFIIWYLYGGIDGKGFWSIDLPEQYASRLAAQNAVDAYVGRKPRFAKYYKVVEVKS